MKVWSIRKKICVAVTFIKQSTETGDARIDYH